MPEIRLELAPEDVRKLDTEVDLLGFSDRGEYLRWIIGNRAAIEQGTERDQLLTEYQARVDELEAELSAQATSGVEAGADATGDVTAASNDRDRARATDGGGETKTANSTTGHATTEQASLSAESLRAGERDQSDGETATTATQGGPRDADGTTSIESSTTGLGGNFTPERVERFEDESLGSHANQLKGVEGERLDEFARRAVAKTRKRLGREPTTGLEYRSGTRIARSSSDVRPGEDLVDLDSLDVPGRSEETAAPRREAVGAALAYLRDVGRAKKGDFVGELYEEYPAGYDTESGWWRCIKRGLKDAPVVDGGSGSRVWAYVPPGSREGELVGSGPKRIVDPD